MATADRMERERKKKSSYQRKFLASRKMTAAEQAAEARKARGMRRSTARSVGRTVSKATSRAASSAAMRKQADARSGRSTTSPRGAMIQRSIGNALTRLPGQDKNSASNKNMRTSATRVVQSSRARVAAQKGGTQRARSAQARAMNRENRHGAQRRRQGK